MAIISNQFATIDAKLNEEEMTCDGHAILRHPNFTEAECIAIFGGKDVDGDYIGNISNCNSKTCLPEDYYSEAIKTDLQNYSVEKLMDMIIHVEFWVNNNQVIDTYCRNLFIEKGGDMEELEIKKKAVIDNYNEWLGSYEK